MKTVLYIEDNPVNAALVKAILSSRSDVRLTFAVDGATGLAQIEADRPDLILLDLRLPDMPGDDLVRKLRQRPAFANLPIIAISGDTLSEQRQQMRELDIAEFIPKPFDIDEFERVIDRYLR